MNAELNAYVVHMVPLVHAISSIPLDGNIIGLLLWVQQPLQPVQCRSLPLCPLQHMSWTLSIQALSNISGLGFCK